MTYVVSLTGYRPPPRFDGVAWTRARIEEAALRAGPWVVLETQDLSPVDTAPTLPQARDFTTALAELVAGWYQVVFLDAAGSEAASEPVSAAQPGHYPPDILPPAPNDVRSRSPLLVKMLPAGSADLTLEPLLREHVAAAIALVQALTGRVIDGTVPAELVDVALRAVTLMTERIAVTSDATFAEQVATGRRLRGFSAGPYSEQYFAPGEFARRGAQLGRPPMDPDEQLDAALWALATEDARDEFVGWATGVFPAAGVAGAFDYRQTPGTYGSLPTLRTWGRY